MPTFFPVPPAMRRLALLLPLLPVGALAGCGGDAGPAARLACPDLQIIPDGGDITRYRGAGRDLTDLVLQGRIVRLSGQCGPQRDGVLHAELVVQAEVTRGPAATGRTADVSFFVAATRGEQILSEGDVPLHVEFPPNTERVRQAGTPLSLALPTPPGTNGSAYQLRVGFRLTPQELALNRARGAR